jgi:hypothetical protein
MCGTIRKVVCVALVLTTAGCSGTDKVVVKGQIVLDGANLALAENEAVLMSLIPVDNKGASPYSGSVSRDGSFVVAGPSDGSGVPPGKYKVSLQTLLTDRERSTDRFGGRYTADKTALDVEVVAGMAPLTLPLTSAK